MESLQEIQSICKEIKEKGEFDRTGVEIAHRPGFASFQALSGDSYAKIWVDIYEPLDIEMIVDELKYYIKRDRL